MCHLSQREISWFIGGFAANQASDGFRACSNIWSGVYDADELLTFTRCHIHGDIFSLELHVGELHGDIIQTECVRVKPSGKCSRQGSKQLDQG